MTADGDLIIKGGRHPVVESFVKQSFVKNDTHLSDDERIMILTGPNMAGKSTYMRQVALIVLMAHMGCFVPADSASICIVDKIFTRVGASDNLASGQSTFMVEMSEVANILNNATPKSLLILDEIGGHRYAGRAFHRVVGGGYIVPISALRRCSRRISMSCPSWKAWWKASATIPSP